MALILQTNLAKLRLLPIGFFYNKLTDIEKQCLTKDEFLSIMAEMIFHNVMTVEEYLEASK